MFVLIVAILFFLKEVNLLFIPFTIKKNGRTTITSTTLFLHDRNSNSWWGRGGPPQKLNMPDLDKNMNTTTISSSSTTTPEHDRPIRIRSRRSSSTKFKDLYKWNTTFFRKFYDSTNTSITTTTISSTNNDPTEFLCSYNYTLNEIQEMTKTSSSTINISSFHVKKDLYPKIQFILHTLGGGKRTTKRLNNKNNDHQSIIISNEVKERIPFFYYTFNLEKTLAPRHAYLMYCNLTHGNDLVLYSSKNKEDRWNEFLTIVKQSDSAFCSLCTKWYYSDHNHNDNSSDNTMILPSLPAFQTFQRMFRRGLLSACRDDTITYDNNISISNSYMVKLLILHGANPLEEIDSSSSLSSGISLFHWACGTGNLKSLQYLIHSIFPTTGKEEQQKEDQIANFILNLKGAKDGATPMHWASCGVSCDNFGSGGHLVISQYLLNIVQNPKNRQKLIHAKTNTGNTPFMWASWSGSLSILKLLSYYNSENEVSSSSLANAQNVNGCTAAHWAASGGHLHICQYLYHVHKVSFSRTLKNSNGHTPLNHAIMFGRDDIVQWIVSSFEGLNDFEEECYIDLQLAQKLLDSTATSSSGNKRKQRKVIVDILKNAVG